MNLPLPKLYYDFVDPLSWLLARELAAVEEIGPEGFEWKPFELHPPPTPLVTRDDPAVAARWRASGSAGPGGRAFAPPTLVPWTRKAHELVHHADASGCAAAVRELVFEAYLFGGEDIGRVDVLVELARSAGLDATEAKAVLDVDRYEARVRSERADALEGGVRTTPTLSASDRMLEGFHNAPAIRTFLGT